LRQRRKRRQQTIVPELSWLHGAAPAQAGEPYVPFCCSAALLVAESHHHRLRDFHGRFRTGTFQEVHGLWRLVLASAINLVPAYIVVAVPAVAWKREWTGAAAFAVPGVWYSWGMLQRHHRTCPIFLGIPPPLLAMAALFPAKWIKRGKLRPAH
jgi:hypothetical protein